LIIDDHGVVDIRNITDKSHIPWPAYWTLSIVLPSFHGTMWRWKSWFWTHPSTDDRCDVYHHPIVTETYACLRSTKSSYLSRSPKHTPKSEKNISVTYHLKITQVYPNRISKISSKHSKHHWPRLELSVAPWTLRRSASRCSACEPDPLEKAKTEDPKGPRENDLHMVGPWESQVGDHSLMNCWIYEVYSQWDLRVYIIVSVVWLPVVGFIDCWDKHDRTII
jgi:hypothetical protein